MISNWLILIYPQKEDLTNNNSCGSSKMEKDNYAFSHLILQCIIVDIIIFLLPIEYGHLWEVKQSTNNVNFKYMLKRNCTDIILGHLALPSKQQCIQHSISSSPHSLIKTSPWCVLLPQMFGRWYEGKLQ